MIDEEEKTATFNRNSGEVNNSGDTFGGIGLVNRSDCNSVVSKTQSHLSTVNSSWQLSDDNSILVNKNDE